MSVERHQRSEQLFHEALKQPRDQREAFLFEACGTDFKLYQEVLSLVRSHEETHGLLDEPHAVQSDISFIQEALTPRSEDGFVTPEGRYHILEVLGEGGMGIVYLANQTHPVRRQVALKVIKLGIDSKRATARFESERQALAVMNHPNIARVYEAGATSDGRLYFAMEYVPGLPITMYCDKMQLPLVDRLKIFIDVCNAIQHAHEKGIIHRDIKPFNVLVSAGDAHPIPKVIDFGVAKAINQRLIEQTLYTHHGVIVGSLEYMSPEQADCRVLDIDTRSDIYSLGVLLYELLVGAHPLDIHSIKEQGYTEIERRIQEEEPRLASQKLLGLGDRAEEIAKNRASDPAPLARRLRGDLDWITAKALEKDRLRRYASASEFAADIQRYMKKEPVLAGPPSPRYRLRKFVERNRGFVTGAIAVVIALTLGFAATGWFLHVAQNQRDGILRLSDVNRLEAQLSEAEDLIPPHPEMVGEMELWLESAGELADRLPHHKRKLLELEQRGVLVAASGVGTVASRDETNRRHYRFDDPEKQFEYDILSGLVERLERFVDPDPYVGTIADVRHRLEFARQVYDESIVKHATGWAEAISSIADTTTCPQYNGLTMAPQIGLVPIGRDPQSGLWEFVVLQSEQPPSRDAEGRLDLDHGSGLVLVLVPGGCFWMGAARDSVTDTGIPTDPYARPDEWPRHRVCLDPFFVSKYEMTQAQWLALTGQNPSEYGPDIELSGYRHTLNHPVENVDWYQAARAMRRMGLALPTEAQWEYAARAGTLSPWWSGWQGSSVEGCANMADQFARHNGKPIGWMYEGWSDGYANTAPVGAYRPNPFGLYDTMGNVFEWCRDLYGSYDLPVDPGDGLRRIDHSPDRVFRGGDFTCSVVSGRVSWRVNHDPEATDRIGVRPARKILPADAVGWER